MSLKQRNYIDNKENLEDISIKEELYKLKNQTERKRLEENPKKALLMWFSVNEKLPVITNTNKTTIYSPVIVENYKFNNLLHLIETKILNRTSLYNIDNVLMDINPLPDLSIQYVDPNGKDIFMKIGFDKSSGFIEVTPFVKPIDNSGYTLDVDDSQSEYTISSKFDPDNNWERIFFFKLKNL